MTAIELQGLLETTETVLNSLLVALDNGWSITPGSGAHQALKELSTALKREVGVEHDRISKSEQVNSD